MDKPKSKCVCGMEFKQKKNLYAHMRKQHNIEPLQPTIIERNFECDFCGSKFCSQSTIIRHIRKFHTDKNNKLIGSNKKISLACPYGECREYFRNYEVLRKHLAEKHDFCVEYEDLTFDSMEEFEQWKDNIQFTTVALFTRSSSVRTMRVQPGRKLYFNCHRSHTYKQRGKNKRAIKAIGTNKTGKACPARLEVMYQECRQDTEAVIQVRFWKTHCGHQHQIERLPLTRQIKCLIAEKLEEGYSFEDTIKMICEVEPNDVISKRLQLLSRKDMYNIVRDFNIKFKKRKYSTKSINHLECNINYTQNNIPHVCNDNSHKDISTINEINIPNTISTVNANKNIDIIDISTINEINIPNTISTVNANKNIDIISAINETNMPNISTLNDSIDIDANISALNENKNNIFTINNRLVDTAQLFLDLVKVADLNVEDSIYMKNEITSIIEKTVKSDLNKPNIKVEVKLEPETDTCNVIDIKNEYIEKPQVSERLIYEINALLNTVRTVSLSQEDSLIIEEQVNKLMKRAKLFDIDKLSEFVNERIQSPERTQYSEKTCEVTVKLERM